MHKLECSAMCVFGENWNPSETVRLTARILAKQVSDTQDFKQDSPPPPPKKEREREEKARKAKKRKFTSYPLVYVHWQLL